MKIVLRIIALVLTVAITMLVMKKCSPQPDVVTKTKTVIVPKIDTVKVVEFKKADTVFVERWKTIKGKDSIIYRDRPMENTITANQYDTTIKSDSAKAHLKITTTGELIDVSGTIEYPEKETIKETTIKIPQSGLFIYGESSLLPTFKRSELGVDYQWKNKVILGSSVSYENISKQVYVNLKIGFRISKN